MKQQIGPQTFIVKMLIISNTDNRPIYIKRKEGGKRLAARETERERESVCERQRVAENRSRVGCKNSCWRNGPFWDKLGSRRKDYLIARNYFNRGIDYTA